MEFQPILIILSISFLGLLVGSFLNVLIVRLPCMLLYTFQEKPEASSLNLVFPASHCPNCQHTIHPLDNIPILSYFLLNGRCRYCHDKISIQYPFVEALSMFLSAVIAFHFGFTLQTIFALLFIWILIALTVIDYQNYILPDQLTLGGMWLGLFASVFSVFQTPADAILGAMIGYLSLYIIYWVFKFLTGKEGLGYGDFKLLAMLGTFCGWQGIPFILLIASLLGSVFGLINIFYFKHDKNRPIPFGPYLCFAGFITILYGQYGINLYLF